MKPNRKRWIGLLLSAALMTALLAGCGSGGDTAAAETASEPAASGQDVLYHCYNSLPYITLDPSVEYSNGIITFRTSTRP